MAIGEVRLSLVAICVIPACPDLEPGLAPLQVGVLG
jgi:hypothetical protein